MSFILRSDSLRKLILNRAKCFEGFTALKIECAGEDSDKGALILKQETHYVGTKSAEYRNTRRHSDLTETIKTI